MGNCGAKSHAPTRVHTAPKKSHKRPVELPPTLYGAERVDVEEEGEQKEEIRTKMTINRTTTSSRPARKRPAQDNVNPSLVGGSPDTPNILVPLREIRAAKRNGRPKKLEALTLDRSDAGSPAPIKSPTSPTLFGNQPVTPRKQLLVLAHDSDIDGVKKLLQEGVSADEITDNDGRLPVAHAAMQGDLRLVKLLVAYGVSLDKLSKDGWSPLHFAVMEQRFDTVKYFLRETSVDVNQKSKHGFTPLSLAVMKNNKSMIALLLKHGADKDAKDPYDKNAQERAAKQGTPEIQALLI